MFDKFHSSPIIIEQREQRKNEEEKITIGDTKDALKIKTSINKTARKNITK